MGLLDRVLGKSARLQVPSGSVIAPTVLGGRETLEVVGESHYQDALWWLAGGFTADPVRHAVTAVLDPEPDNPEDKNAIRVIIDGRLVGYLSREDAAIYLPGAKHLQSTHGPIGLQVQIVGGGQREGRLGMLGVFLDHDPGDFGLRKNQIAHIGELRTGLTQAADTDLEDDSYDLSWFDRLSGNHAPADVVTLRKLLTDETDPIDRHFMLAELGKCLYKCRDAFTSALEEFDAVCVQHDTEMVTIRVALSEKFGAVPVIEMYRQAVIRCQKARDWNGMRFWADRGLTVYGTDAARPEAVADLQKRLAHAEAKLATGSAPARSRAATSNTSTNGAAAVETLTCVACGTSFERVRGRGRKPHRCPDCRELEGSPVAVS